MKTSQSLLLIMCVLLAQTETMGVLQYHDNKITNYSQYSKQQTNKYNKVRQYQQEQYSLRRRNAQTRVRKKGQRVLIGLNADQSIDLLNDLMQNDKKQETHIHQHMEDEEKIKNSLSMAHLMQACIFRILSLDDRHQIALLRRPSCSRGKPRFRYVLPQ